VWRSFLLLRRPKLFGPLYIREDLDRFLHSKREVSFFLSTRAKMRKRNVSVRRRVSLFPPPLSRGWEAGLLFSLLPPVTACFLSPSTFLMMIRRFAFSLSRPSRLVGPRLFLFFSLYLGSRIPCVDRFSPPLFRARRPHFSEAGSSFFFLLLYVHRRGGYCSIPPLLFSSRTFRVLPAVVDEKRLSFILFSPGEAVASFFFYAILL